jgi:hypothetical protein
VASISRHQNLEEAECRMRLIVGGPVYYDADGRVVNKKAALGNAADGRRVNAVQCAMGDWHVACGLSLSNSPQACMAAPHSESL